jgi:hypothetical protein
VAANVLVVRATRDAGTSQQLRQKAEADLERVRKAAEEIRRMTRLYQERLEGRRRVQ